MNKKKFKQSEFHFRAFCVSKQIDLTKAAQLFEFEQLNKRREFITYELESKSFLLLFSFGSVVFVNVDGEIRQQVMDQLQSVLIQPTEPIHTESYVLRNSGEKMDITNEHANVLSITMDEIEITARILAQSVALDQFEHITDEVLVQIKAMNSQLERTGRFPKRSKAIVQFSAQISNIIQSIITDLSILDKPNVLWDNTQLEILFSQLADVFELRSRFRSIEYKINFAHTNSEFALNVLASRRATLLEIIIVILILGEIILYFFGG